MDLPYHCQWGAAMGASLVAACCDVRTGRIPNWLTALVAALGLVCAGGESGLDGFGEAAAAWVALALPFVVLFVFAQGGAGDAKMMGALGTWLGLRRGLIVLCCVAIVGGVLVVLRMIVHRQRRRLLSGMVATAYIFLIALAAGLGGLRLLKPDAGERASADSQRVTIPYGMAIFLGTCVGAVVVYVWNP